MRNLLYASLVAFAAAGCATVSTEEALNADYGPTPTAQQFISTVEATIKRRLKDPSSAQFQYPYNAAKGWYKQPFGKTYFGFWTCGLVNAKNSFGGYTGFDYFVAVYNNGRIIYSNVASSTEDLDWTRAGCENSREGLANATTEYDVPLSEPLAVEKHIPSDQEIWSWSD